MQRYYESVFGIVDPLSTCYGNTLTGKFVTGNEIAVSAYRPITSTTRDEPTEHAEKHPVHIHILKPEFIFDDPILRSLVAESNAAFVALQMLKKSGTKNDYLKISRTYRSIIRACLEKLNAAVISNEAHHNSKALMKYTHSVSVFYSTECIWHLCEILLLDQTPTNVVVLQLLEWVRFHIPATERKATELLLMGYDACDSDDYWPTIKGLITQGQVEICRALLQLHKSAANPQFVVASEILRTLPVYNAYGGTSIQKFRSQWQYWLDDTERKLEANILSAEPNLEEIIQLVRGDNDMWDTYMKKSEDWYEFLPGYLFYTNPACKHFELGAFANSWLTRWARLKGCEFNELELADLDRIILNLMENNMSKVISAIQNMADNNWFATHLIDLLYNCGQLQSAVIQESSTQLRDSLLFDFGSNLMTRNHLWQLGIEYMEYCTEEGVAALELLLTKIPIRTEKQALKIVALAQRKELFSAEEEICKVQAKKSFDQKRYGNALEWAIRSKDTLYVTSIADFLLKHYSKTGDMLCPDVVSNIGAKMFLSPRLVFLVKYVDFYQLYRKRDFLPAAELLVNLLESKITPEYFWLSLLIDAIPLLESKDQKIGSKETSAILYHLESELMPLIEEKKRKQEKFPDDQLSMLRDYRIENIEEIVNLMRLACARNMSRAIIVENTIPS